MPVHGKHSGTWKEGTPSGKLAGTWEDGSSTTNGAVAVFGKLSGSWRMAWPLTSDSLTFPVTGVGTYPTVTTMTVGVNILEDGRFALRRHSGVYSHVNFCDNAPYTDKGGAAPTLFQCKWNHVSGDAMTTYTMAEDTWVDLDSVKQIWMSFTGVGYQEAEVEFHIRAKAAPTSILVATVSMIGEIN